MRRWGVALLLAATATAGACALAQVRLRVSGLAPVEFHRIDPKLGSSLVPGPEGSWNREGHAQIRISSDGLRDREHTLAKPPGTLRIAVLGDSYAEAFQVPMEAAFWSVLERELGACPALTSPVEVLNFGVAGHGTAQQLPMLRERAWRYEPDVVLLAFFSGNDVRNNSRELQGSSGRPHFVLDGDTLVLDDRFARKWEMRWRSNPAGQVLDLLLLRSRVVSLFGVARAAWRQRAEARNEAAEPAGNEIGLDDEIYRPPRDPAWQAAWRVTAALLRQMRDEVAARGARFHLVVLSNGIQVHPDAAARAPRGCARSGRSLLPGDAARGVRGRGRHPGAAARAGAATTRGGRERLRTRLRERVALRGTLERTRTPVGRRAHRTGALRRLEGPSVEPTLTRRDA